jgi:hypothetical protein
MGVRVKSNSPRNAIIEKQPPALLKKLFGDLRRELGPLLRGLARQPESQIEEGCLMSDKVTRAWRQLVSRGVSCICLTVVQS